MFCFRQRELGDRRAEAELKPLQQDRMVHGPLRPPPVEYPIAQYDFHAFGFAFDTAIKLVKFLKYLHRGSGGRLVSHPLVSTCFPLVQCRHPFGIAVETYTYGATCGRLIPGLKCRYFLERILPAGFQPRLDECRRNWWIGKSWAGNLKYEIRVLSLGRRPIVAGRGCRHLSGRRSPLPDRRMVW